MKKKKLNVITTIATEYVEYARIFLCKQKS